jgi:hypothetical protein
MKAIKFSIFILCFLFVQNKLLSAQSYKLSNELEIYSFETSKGKKLSICKDKNDKYLVYRFGTKSKVELQYPAVLNEESWGKFSYSFYFRGGGKENAAMDINSLTFVNGGFKYSVYDDYSAETDETTVGITVTQLSNKKETNIKGVLKTKKGALSAFRDNDLVDKEEE